MRLRRCNVVRSVVGLYLARPEMQEKSARAYVLSLKQEFGLPPDRQRYQQRCRSVPRDRRAGNPRAVKTQRQIREKTMLQLGSFSVKRGIKPSVRGSRAVRPRRSLVPWLQVGFHGRPNGCEETNKVMPIFQWLFQCRLPLKRALRRYRAHSHRRTHPNRFRRLPDHQED